MGGEQLSEEIRFRVYPSTKKVVEEIAEEEKESVSEVARNLLRLSLDSFAGDRRIEMKQLREAIESKQEDLKELKKAWKEVTGEEWRE